MAALSAYVATYISNTDVVDCVMGVLTMVLVIGIVKCLTVGLFSK